MKKIHLQSLVIIFCLMAAGARAAELSGVRMPDYRTVDGTQLTLNGLALRTVSLLRVRVYVVGLYLDEPTHDADAIILSSKPKLLRFVFLRDIAADKARNVWRRSISTNCPSPCRLPDSEVTAFLNSVPAMHKGDIADVLFTHQGVNFTVNGHSLGWVTDPNFARVILLSYIGPNAKPALVKNEILGMR